MLTGLMLALLGCGGSSGQSVDPAGTWAVTDTLKTGGCAASATETITVVGHVLQGYAMTSSWCVGDLCELQGTLNGVSRDLQFFADGTAGGNRSQSGCLYSSAGQRSAH